jgi:hypothetical protein
MTHWEYVYFFRRFNFPYRLSELNLPTRFQNSRNWEEGRTFEEEKLVLAKQIKSQKLNKMG